MSIEMNPRKRARVASIAGITIAGLLLGAGTAAAACVADTRVMLSGPNTFPYEVVNVGDVVTYAMGTGVIFKNCDPWTSADLTIEAGLKYYGAVNDIATFETGTPYVGVQLEYKYVEGVTTAAPIWSDWIRLGAHAADFNARAWGERGESIQAIRMQFRATYVALKDFENEEFGTGDLDPLFNLTDNTYGEDVSSPYAIYVGFRPFKKAWCAFTSTPPENLTLGVTYNWELRNVGDMGKPTDFSFEWSCLAGDDKGDNADFRFTSSNAGSEAEDGRLSVEGGAKGVEMLVTSKRGTDVQVPIKFDWWYSRLLGPLPNKGKHEMQVRFIRNADALQPGDATSSLTIELEPY